MPRKPGRATMHRWPKGRVMTTTTEHLELLAESTEENLVTSWRLHVLLRAGYEEAQARSLALRRDVDLHEAVELVRRGCPPEVAYRIVS
jgi:hypothetical protein